MRKNIALYVSYLDNEFSMDIIDGAWLAAEEADVNLFIMPVRLVLENYSDKELNRFEYQYNTMFSYADCGNFDGAIVETGIICNGMAEEKVQQLFESFGVPTVSIARKIDGYPNVRFNSNGLRDEIQHLIDKHHCKRIGFIGGPANNPDAIERLELYKKTLADNGIPYDESLYGMGNYSEFCDDEVKKVISRNKGNIDALCFANDRMAIGGYWALESLGLVPGKDILITGFDDAPSAAAMEPALTTVHSNVAWLGQIAVEKCLDMINGKPCDDANIDTSVIIRSSCGCPTKVSIINEKISSAENVDPENLCNEIYTFLCGSLHEKTETCRIIRNVTDVFLDFLRSVSLPDFKVEDNINKIYNAIEKIDFSIISYHEFSLSLNLVRQKAMFCAINKADAGEYFYRLFDRITEEIYAKDYKHTQNYRELSHVSSAIIYDVLSNIDNESASYMSIIKNVHRHNTINCYLFMHEFPVSFSSFSDWKRPSTERLICYHNKENEVLLPEHEQQIHADKMFRCNKISDEQHTFFVNPLFYNDEQYGLLFSEMSKANYRYLAWVIVKQISYALKAKRLMEEQMYDRMQLTRNMEIVELYNKSLHKETISDELTGILNRRGFTQSVGNLLSDPSNYGKKAMIAFADMNSLKTVNDNFGHDEGDFAIKGIAEMLTKCFRQSDVVARFGGDEFAAFGFIREGNFEKLCRNRLNKIADNFNASSGKPYLVTTSIGIYEFICTPDSVLFNCMNAADALLYEDKKHKPLSILRTAPHKD